TPCRAQQTPIAPQKTLLSKYTKGQPFPQQNLCVCAIRQPSSSPLNPRHLF
ncbi:hypothetical protein K504DRAFT_536555, partial [Pleomassaria siparia CBS 279.74]